MVSWRNHVNSPSEGGDGISIPLFLRHSMHPLPQRDGPRLETQGYDRHAR